MHRWTRIVSLAFATLALAGCARPQAAPPAPKPPEVLVGLPLTREVTDYEVFTGRVEPSERVEIRARVTGYLDKANFRDGALVAEGELLFVIDPQPARAELARAEAAQTQAQARLDRLERDVARTQVLIGQQAASREELDRLTGERDEARAAIGVARSNVDLAKLTVRYTEVRAPFAGRVSRRIVDPGNLVKADETILTTLMALEPLYIYFDVDERTLLRQLLLEGRLESARHTRLAIRIGLSDEDGYPHEGVVNFVDNRVDPSTGTMWMRGEFVKMARPIQPGVFGRVRFPLGEPFKALVVAEQALGTDQGQKFVYVVNEKNQAEYRPVKVGRLHDGFRVIRDGLKQGERVVVSGLQRVRPNAEVTPKPVEMERLVVRSRAEEDAPSKTKAAAPTPARSDAKTEGGS